MSPLKKESWSPYLVGTGIGGLLIFLFMLGEKIGVSTGIARVAAWIEWLITPAHVAQTPYFASLLKNGVVFDWSILFMIGLILGSIFAYRLSSRTSTYSNSALQAFIGGILLMFGARLANGCTSGHAISGAAQFSITSWIFMMAFFMTAIPTAMLAYRKS
ncbi:MAG: YeeE/YedE family protein [Simkaniaceae bacterium]|nr:YeeE/YedE family protein [Simkaniaceae bacterium]